MSDIDTPLSRLDMWIAGTMHATADAVRRLADRGLGLLDAQRVARELKIAGLGDHLRLSPDVLTALIGSPLRQLRNGLLYELDLWPKHLYRWHLQGDMRTVSDGGFRRREEEPVRVAMPLTFGGVSTAFHAWLHTDEDVEKALGTPVSEDSWWPQQSVRYGLAERDGQVVFTV